MAKGFVVYVEGMDAPRVMHKNYDSAYLEAIRLSKRIEDKKSIFIGISLLFRERKKSFASISTD